VFERFTAPAKQAITRAQDEAIALGHDYIGTEHILLGLTHVTGGTAARVLAESGVTAGRARDQISRLPPPPGHPAGPSPAEALAAIGIDVDEIRRRADRNFGPGQFVFPRPAFTPRGKEALTLSLQAAQDLGDADVDTRHLLLGLLAEGQNRAIDTLQAIGADPGQLRSAVLGRTTTA
jgi:ATP-dependent Clp protease ATP-binding subunit ClpC